MAEITKHRDTAFCWAELQTRDVAAAKQFLAGLYPEWEMVDVPMGEDMVYTLCMIDGKKAVAIQPMNPQMMEQGIPSYWHIYLNVEDVDARYAAALEAGATSVAPPFDAMDMGRMAMIQDPTGAGLSLWQAKSHIGAEAHNIPGTIAWNELSTSDPAAATEFYTKVFGWSAPTMEMPDGVYTMWTLEGDGGGGVGGMMKMPDGMDVPPHWSLYINVFDVEASAKKAKELGATLPMDWWDAEGVGQMAVVQHPAAGYFYLFKSAN